MKSLEDLEKAFDRGLNAWESNVLSLDAMQIGQKLVREVKRKTPVKTGNLRRRWDSSVQKGNGDLQIIVSNDAEYAAPVNNGHRVVIHGKERGYKEGHHMLERGISSYQDNYLKDDLEQMINHLNQAMKG